MAHLSHRRSCSPMRDTEFLVQSSLFEPWLIPCGIFRTHCVEITLLSEGQAGISRAKVIKLAVQKRERLYFQALQLSFKVRAGERHRGSGSACPAAGQAPRTVQVWERDGDRSMGRVVPLQFVTLQGLSALQTTTICTSCSWDAGLSFSRCESGRGPESCRLFLTL